MKLLVMAIVIYLTLTIAYPIHVVAVDPTQYSDVHSWPAWTKQPDWNRQEGELVEAVRWELSSAISAPSNLTLSPGTPITQLEAAQVLTKVLGMPRGGEGTTPTVVEPLAIRGLTISKPEQVISRLEMARWIYRILVLYGFATLGPPPAWTDLDQLQPEDRLALTTLGEAHIFKGYEDGTFQPFRPLARGEAAIVGLRVATRLRKNAPDPAVLMAPLRAEGVARTLREREALRTGWLDFTDSLPHFSEAALLGANGIADQQRKCFEMSARSYAEVEEISITPVVLADEIAQLHANTRLIFRSADGVVTAQYHEEMDVFLAKRNGQWVITSYRSVSPDDT